MFAQATRAWTCAEDASAPDTTPTSVTPIITPADLTASNESDTVRRTTRAKGAPATTSMTSPAGRSGGRFSFATASTADVETKRCPDGAYGSRDVTTISGPPRPSIVRCARRNKGQSSTIVSNSPPSPAQWLPYSRSIFFRKARIESSDLPRCFRGSSPIAATLIKTASTFASQIKSRTSPCGCCHRNARLTKPKSAHTASTLRRW